LHGQLQQINFLNVYVVWDSTMLLKSDMQILVINVLDLKLSELRSKAL